MATCAIFGNMFGIDGVSLILPVLPLLPKQTLLTHLLIDFPKVTIATDQVDIEMVDHPRRWNIKAIRKFMITFGIVSSVFDYLTFGVLQLKHASWEQFRTGWFIKSVISAYLIVLVIRTWKTFRKSQPGKSLLFTSFVIVIILVFLLSTPVTGIFGFTALPLVFLLIIGFDITHSGNRNNNFLLKLDSKGLGPYIPRWSRPLRNHRRMEMPCLIAFWCRWMDHPSQSEHCPTPNCLPASLGRT